MGVSQIKNKQHLSDFERENLLIEIDNFEINHDFEIDFNIIKKYESKIERFKILNSELLNKEPSKESARLSYLLGVFYRMKGNYSVCEKYFRQAHEQYTFFSPNQLMLLYNTLADIEKVKYNYIISISLFKKCLMLARKHKNKYEEFRAIREIGVIYRELGNFIKAEEYFLEAKELISTAQNKRIEGFWLNLHLGRLYRLKKEWKKSFFYYTKAQENNNFYNPHYKTQVLNEMGLYWTNRGNIDSAMYYFDKTIQTFELNKDYDLHTTTESLVNIGDLHLLKKDSLEALNYYIRSFKLSKKNGIYRSTRIAAIKIIKLIPKEDKFRSEVLEFITNSYRNEDAAIINSKRFALQLDELELKKQEIEIQKKKVRNRKLFMYILIPSIIILLLGLYYLIRIKKEIKEGKLELENLNTDLTSSNKKLKVLNKKLNQFSSFVAHDIKSSVAGIQFLVGQIQKKESYSKTNSEILIPLFKESEKLNSFVNFLVSKTKRNVEREAKYELININSLLEEINENINARLNLHNPLLTWSENNITFKGHKIQLMQLFINLTENSIKYKHPDRQPKINIVLSKTDNKLLVAISDNGIGISEDKQLSIFDIFTQSREEDSKIGNGIGLSICRNIVKQYNGKIWVEQPSNNVGVIFNFEIIEFD